MKEAQASASEKLPPIHPGEILNEEFLRPMNITRSRLAEAIGVDPRCIHAIVRGQRSITPETALLLSRLFGNSAQFWIGLQSQYQIETAGVRPSHTLNLMTPYVPLCWEEPRHLNSLRTSRDRGHESWLPAESERAHGGQLFSRPS